MSDPCADDAGGKGLLVGGDGGCGFAPGRVEGSRLADAAPSPYRNCHEKVVEKKK